MASIFETVTNVGLSKKASEVYVAALELGEATILELSKRARLKRTTIYYTLEELLGFGALIATKRNKKQYFLAVEPSVLLERARERLYEFEHAVPDLKELQHNMYPRPHIEFHHGVPGFKNVWEKIFTSAAKEYCIITSGELFLNFVKEKYVIDEIIARKKKLAIRSRQLISDSQYARKIVAKDREENRESRLISPPLKFPFTTIICKEFVSFVSPRHENMMFVVQNESFAKTQQSLFDAVWERANPSFSQ